MTITFTFQYPNADLEQVRAVVEQLRQKATDFGLTGVGGLVCLSGDEIATHEFGEWFKLADENITPVLPTAVCFFDGKLLDNELMLSGGNRIRRPCPSESPLSAVRLIATGILWITVMPTSDPAVFSTLTRGDVTRPVPRRYLREAESRRERLIPYASE